MSSQQKTITFLAHILSADGIKPDLRKINAILDMHVPDSKVKLQRFFGMINYLGKFIKNLSSITAPLRDLLQKDVLFRMEKPQIDAIGRLKEIVTSHAVLKCYDPTLPLRVRTDGSTEGLGAILERQVEGIWHPVTCASRSLTSAETNYSSIEAETLSIVFGCQSFHEYVYGRSFLIQNDYQPLNSIFKRPITCCPPRFQRGF